MEKKKKKKNMVSTKPLSVRLYTYRWFYLMFVPVLAFMLIFHILPLTGLRYMFYHYTNAFNIKWIGLENFRTLFTKPAFWSAFVNTLELSIIKLLLKAMVYQINN